MKYLVRIAIAVVTFALLPCQLGFTQDTPKSAVSDERQLKELQGSWEGTEAGREPRGKVTLVVSGNSIEFRGADRREWYKAKITLPAGTDPKQLHGVITESPLPEFVGKTSVSIYKIENGTLTLAGRKPGNPEVPKDFQDSADTRTFILKKVADQKE